MRNGLPMSTEDVVTQIAKRVQTLACQKCNQRLDVSECEMFSLITCPHCQTRQKVPAQLEQYLLYDVLGRGGMAAVYRAYDTTLGRHVAIKVMRRELSEDPKFISNFLREARAAAQLNHRNIVQIYTVGRSGDQPYIVMELLGGGRLDEAMVKKSPLPESWVLGVARDVAEGLSMGSRIGIVHGDIKPANILFDPQGVAKVSDFGLARFQARKIKQGEIWGTPYYIAPEKVRGGKEDQRSDIYSLGATLFHAFTNHPPFDAETATDVVMARLKQPPPDLNSLRADLHPQTVALVARMLEPDPARRYPNYISLLDDINSAIRASQTEPSASSGAAPISSRGRGRAAAPRSRGKRIVMTLTTAVIVAATIAVLKYITRRPSSPPPASSGAGTTRPPVDLTPVQPFSAEDQERLKKIAAQFSIENSKIAETAWAEMARDLPQKHPGRAWLALFTAVSPWIRGDGEEVRKRIRALDDKTFEPQPNGDPHPGLMPQSLARVMLGRSLEIPPSPQDRPWPDWYLALTEMFTGVFAIQNGDLALGITRLEKYDAFKSKEADWVTGFQPAARQWAQTAREWKAEKEKALAASSAQRPAKLAALVNLSREAKWQLVRADMVRVIEQLKPAKPKRR